MLFAAFAVAHPVVPVVKFPLLLLRSRPFIFTLLRSLRVPPPHPHHVSHPPFRTSHLRASRDAIPLSDAYGRQREGPDPKLTKHA